MKLIKSSVQTGIKRATLWVFLLLLLYLGSIQSSSAQEIQGAELYHNNISQDSVELVLRKFIACDQSVSDEAEWVSLHDPELAQLFAQVKLEKQITKKVSGEDSLECTGEPACIQIVTYSTIMDLPMKSDGYDMSWGWAQVDREALNMEMKEQGINLLTHIADPWTASKNAAPELNIAALQVCGSSELWLGALDADQQETQVSLKMPSSTIAKKDRMYYHSPQNKYERPNSTGSCLTSVGPFQALDFAVGFDERNLFGTGKTIFNKKEHLLSIPEVLPGKYVVGLTLSDHSDGNTLSEHQAFIIIDIKNETSYK